MQFVSNKQLIQQYTESSTHSLELMIDTEHGFESQFGTNFKILYIQTWNNSGKKLTSIKPSETMMYQLKDSRLNKALSTIKSFDQQRFKRVMISVETVTKDDITYHQTIIQGLPQKTVQKFELEKLAAFETKDKKRFITFEESSDDDVKHIALDD